MYDNKNTNRKVILFLYTVLADYFYQCIQSLVLKHPIHAVIISYPLDNDAPFIFENSEHIQIIPKQQFKRKEQLEDFIVKLNPVLLFTAGWSDVWYRMIAQRFKSQIPTIAGLDNPWKATLIQKIKLTLGSLLIRRSYSYLWVSGYPQYEFAKRLGFKDTNIIFNLYCANEPLFTRVYQKYQKIHFTKIPKKLLFLGRFVEYKNPLKLLEVFTKLYESGKTNGWELHFVGEGHLRSELLPNSDVPVFLHEFCNPVELPDLMHNYGGFCLPSQGEHWGVVVHEAALSGLPLLLSQSVYSQSSFLIQGFNGYSFDIGDDEDLKMTLTTFFNLDDARWQEMSDNSRYMGSKITHDDWVANLMSVIL